MVVTRIAAASFTLAAVMGLGACATMAAGDELRLAPRAGRASYSYLASERAAGQPETGYRMEFDLETGPDGSVWAVVHRAEQRAAGAWTRPKVEPGCAAALGGKPGELARVRLAPLSRAAAATLGDDFMHRCAPAALFFPMTDILNLVLIQTAPEFGIARLKRVGDRVRFGRFETRFDRLDLALALSAPGGVTALDAVDGRHVTVDWTPEPMELAMTRRVERSRIALKGVESLAFRLRIDGRTGQLLRASTLHDRLDLRIRIPGSQASPRVSVERQVTVERVTPRPF